MSPPFHHLSFRAFVHATEDPAKVEQALRLIVGDDVTVEVDQASGFHGNPITVLHGDLDRNRRIDALWTRLAEAGLADELLDELDRRLDEENRFHLRLRKAAAHGGRLRLARDAQGDVIDVSGKVEAYPAKREKALAALRTYLEALRAEVRAA